MSKRIALITGASRGIGRSIAYTLAEAGYNLLLTCHNRGDLLLEVKKEVEQLYGITCDTFQGDMGSYDIVQNLFKQFSHKLSDLELVVNNAGISYIGLLSDMSKEEWNQVISTNLSSVFYVSKAALPYFIHKKIGKIINISSVWGTVGASCEVAYSASKSGVHGFTKALAKELAPSNIQVNAIACGFIDTDMNHELDSDEKKAVIEEIPMGRMGSSDEVAHLVLSLAKETSYMTGQIITLDGGWI